MSRPRRARRSGNARCRWLAVFPSGAAGWGHSGWSSRNCAEPGDRWNILHDHAHNDFLELWIEGGTIQLVVALIVICLVVGYGVRTFRRHADSGMGRLALGALAGFLAVTVQSFVDFGLHIPAVAVLAAVVAAMLANLAEAPPSEATRSAGAHQPGCDEAPQTAPTHPAAWPGGLSLGALVQAGALVAVGLFLVSAGQRRASRALPFGRT